MKAILLILLTCLPLCAATTYPMLSTTTNRTVNGGVTNMSLLNANQTFTGTNTFPAASFYPANNIGMRLLWSSPTNIYLSSLATTATLDFTNNGDFSLGTYVASANIPPFLGSNSTLVLCAVFVKTNANTSNGMIGAYIGANTNFIGYVAFANTSVGAGAFGLGSHVFQSANSSTLQVQSSLFINPSNLQLTTFCDTSITNTIYFNAFTASGHTNAQMFGFKLYEVYAP
jgi:hypothetical protein